jgi:hypothetical protein
MNLMMRILAAHRTAGLLAAAVLVFLMAVPIAAAQSPPVAPPHPPRDAVDYVTQIGAPVLTLITLIVGIVTINRNIRGWKWTYFTKEWSALMQFIQPQAKFMDPLRTAEYKKNFIDEDAMKYEMVARLCIAYLDDLYFIRSEHEIRTWFRGSVKLFAGTHRKWLEDHKDSYDPGFYKFIVSLLDP